MRKSYSVVIDGHAQTLSASAMAAAVSRAVRTFDRELRAKGPRFSLERRLRKQSFIEIRISRRGDRPGSSTSTAIAPRKEVP